MDGWPPEEVNRWLAYTRVEGLPDPSWSAATIARTVASTMGGYKGGLAPFLPPVVAGPVNPKLLRAMFIAAFGRKAVVDVEG